MGCDYKHGKNRILEDKYQNGEQVAEPQLNSKRTASEQQVNTNKESKERIERGEGYYYSSQREDNVLSNSIRRESFDAAYRSEQDKKDYDDLLRECGVCYETHQSV